MSVPHPLSDDSHDDLPYTKFDFARACQGIHEACSVYGADEERLVDILGSASPEQRTEICGKYEELYGKELKTVIKTKCSGEFGLALQLLSLPPHVAEAKLIKMAFGRLHAAGKQIYPILCGRSKVEMCELKRTYLEAYNQDLGDVASRALSGVLKTFVTTCLEGTENSRYDRFSTEEKARLDAKDIFVAFTGKYGDYLRIPFITLCSSTPEHLMEINSAYEEKYNMTLHDAFGKELKGTAGKAATFTVGMKLRPYDTVAQLVNSTCTGFVTDSLLLTSCLIRYQPIMDGVMKSHLKLFSESIDDLVKRKTKGIFRMLLLRVINAAAGGSTRTVIPQGPQCIRTVRVNIPPWARPGDKLNVLLGEDKDSSSVIIPERNHWHYDTENDAQATCFFLQPITEDIISVAAL